MLKLISFLFFLIFSHCHALEIKQDIAKPYFYGVNLVTGKVELDVEDSIQFELYQEGENFLHDSINLTKEDFRIGRVRLILIPSENSTTHIYLSYHHDETLVYNSEQLLTIYSYSPSHLIQTIAIYQKNSSNRYQLYRLERFFWSKEDETPQLINRTLEDEKGEILMCHCFYYNDKKQLIKDTLVGNLSGTCHIACEIGKGGYPEKNGVETYSTTYFYSDVHPDLIIKQMEDNGMVTSYQYDPITNQCLNVQKNFGDVPLNRKTLTSQPENFQQEPFNCISIHGNETTDTYDFLGRVIATQFPAVLDIWDKPYLPVIQQSYDICDQVTKMIDPSGAETTLSYNIRGKPVNIHYPDGTYETFTYFLDGELKEKREREGMVYSFTRDHACRVISAEKRSPFANVLQTLFYTYQGENIQTVSDGKTFTIHYLYDQEGHQTAVSYETVDGSREMASNDSVCSQINNVPQWLSPTNEWKAPYTNRNRVFQENEQKLTLVRTSLIQNSIGQFVNQDEKVDPNGICYLFTYDALDRLESLVKYDPMGLKLSEVQCRYDGNGNKVLEKHHVIKEGKFSHFFSIHWQYGPCKHLLAMTEEGDHGQSKMTRYHYDSFGRLDQIIKPDGTTISYSYHDNGQIKKIEASDHSISYHYLYDHLQQLVAVEDCYHQYRQNRSYNAFHELTEDEQAPGISVRHVYDSAGRRIRLLLPDLSAITYNFQGDLLASIKRLTSDEKLKFANTYFYDENRQLLSCRLGNLKPIEFSYLPNGQLKAIDSSWWKEKIEKNEFDLNGRLIGWHLQDHFHQFAYTPDGQLAEEKGHTYMYDSLFNRLRDNQSISKVNSLNQLEQTAEENYQYDLNGNLVERCNKNGTNFYRYDALDRLVQVEYPQHIKLSYDYDSYNRRISEKVLRWDSQKKNWSIHSLNFFLYDGFNEIGIVNEKGEIVELKILGLDREGKIEAAVAMELEGKCYLPIHDSFGSVRSLIDAEKEHLVESYDFTAFGQEVIRDADGNCLKHSLVNNPWRFCSKRIDNETGFVFFGRRHYDPKMGRWISPDPCMFVDGPNLYTFVNNDPLNCHDRYGLFSISQIWNRFISTFYYCFNYLQNASHHFKIKWIAELKLPSPIGQAFDKIGKTLFGESSYFLMGPHFEETHIDYFGTEERSDKVRVTFINGILNTRYYLLQTLKTLSNSHGGIKIHYVFRPTEGWTWDITRAFLVRTTFKLGFRSRHTYLLAKLWKDLIQEMGGTEGGGTIIHYAHSLGGSETDRARELLTPEEQKMIRVFTFGSSTFIHNLGFQNVTNFVGINDGVSSFFIEPFGFVRNIFDPDSNVRFRGSFFRSPFWPTDHLLNGPTYGPIIEELGKKFLSEF